MRTNASPRLLATAAAAVVLAGVVAAGVLTTHHDRGAPERSMMAMTRAPSDPVTSTSTEPASAGTRARFIYLAAQHSNRCDLQMQSMMRYPGRMMLQGACCSPMDYAHYRAQATALRGYDESVIPRDPYDVPVALAKRLLGYEHSIRLDPAERAAYDRAMRLSPEHGPCCCHCWRWDTFAGMSKYLITVDHFSAPRLGTLIGDLDGCGGPQAD